MRLSDSHGSAQRVVFPPMVHRLVQTAIQVVNLEAVHVTHGASLAQPHALLLRCDGGTVAALTVTQQYNRYPGRWYQSSGRNIYLRNQGASVHGGVARPFRL
jgi:poly-gamma-glutamate capsule biosynthesis protein CapA/YwtB (metallophosphatase superfamily)